MSAQGRRVAQVLGWVTLLATILWLSLRAWGSFQVGVYQDDAQYLVLARSLAEGDAYGLINEPGEPPAPKHPFGFPLVIAPIVWLFPQQLMAGAAVSLAATLINVSLLFWGWPLLSPSTGRWWGLGAAALYGLGPRVLGLTQVGLSEPTFVMFSLAALLLVEGRRGQPRGISAFAVGVMLAFALFTRWLGLAVWAAVVVRIAMSRRGAGASLVGVFGGGAASLALILALTPVEVRHLVPVGYIAELQEGQRPTARRPMETTFVQRMLRVASGYAFSDLRRVLIPAGGGNREQALAERIGLPVLPLLASIAVFALVVLGTWSAWHTRALAASVLLYELFCFAALCLWPWHSERLLYLLQPFLPFQLLLGVRVTGDIARHFLGRGSGPARIPIEAVAAGTALLVLSVLRDLPIADSRTATRDLSIGTTWLAENTPAGAIVMTEQPQTIFLYSGRRTVPLPPDADLERSLHGVDYVLLGPALVWRDDGALAYDPPQERALRVLEGMAAEQRATEVYRSSDRELVRVFRVGRQ